MAASFLAVASFQAVVASCRVVVASFQAVAASYRANSSYQVVASCRVVSSCLAALEVATFLVAASYRAIAYLVASLAGRTREQLSSQLEGLGHCSRRRRHDRGFSRESQPSGA